MLGQPSSMLIPEVVGFRLHGRLSEGRDGHGSGFDRYRKCCARKVSSENSWSSMGSGSVYPERSGPRHHCQHVPRVWRDHGLLPR